MPFFSSSHHVSMRQETRAAVSSLRTCKDKVMPDAADRTEMTQHPEGAAGHRERSPSIWQSCFILCGAIRALRLLRRMPLLEARTRSAGGLSAPKSRASIIYSTVFPPVSWQHANNCCKEVVAGRALTLFYYSSIYLQFLITCVTKNKAGHAFAWSCR